MSIRAADNQILSTELYMAEVYHRVVACKKGIKTLLTDVNGLGICTFVPADTIQRHWGSDTLWNLCFYNSTFKVSSPLYCTHVAFIISGTKMEYTCKYALHSRYTAH